MKSLLSTWWLQHLQNLEEINVSHCDEMEKLILEENEETGEGSRSNSSFPRLRKLNLLNLPKLKCIWEGDVICDSLQIVAIARCLQLKRLPEFRGDHQSPSPALKEIKAEKHWWDSLVWDHRSTKILLQPFFIEETLWPEEVNSPSTSGDSCVSNMHLPVLEHTDGNTSSPSSTLTLDLLLKFEMGTSQEGLNNHSTRVRLVPDLNLPVAVDTEAYSSSSYCSPALDLNLGF